MVNETGFIPLLVSSPSLIWTKFWPLSVERYTPCAAVPTKIFPLEFKAIAISALMVNPKVSQLFPLLVDRNTPPVASLLSIAY